MIKRRSAEKGQKAREEAEREYEEQKAKRDLLEQARIDKQIAKRTNVGMNLDKSEGEGFFASLVGEVPSNTTKQDAPLMALQYLRERLTTANLVVPSDNSKEVLHGTRLNARMGPIASGIAKLANLVHRQVLSDVRHVANLESLKDVGVWYRHDCCCDTRTIEGIHECALCPRSGCDPSRTRGRAAKGLWQMTQI